MKKINKNGAHKAIFFNLNEKKVLSTILRYRGEQFFGIQMQPASSAHGS